MRPGPPRRGSPRRERKRGRRDEALRSARATNILEAKQGDTTGLIEGLLFIPTLARALVSDDKKLPASSSAIGCGRPGALHIDTASVLLNDGRSAAYRRRCFSIQHRRGLQQRASTAEMGQGSEAVSLRVALPPRRDRDAEGSRSVLLHTDSGTPIVAGRSKTTCAWITGGIEAVDISGLKEGPRCIARCITWSSTSRALWLLLRLQKQAHCMADLLVSCI